MRNRLFSRTAKMLGQPPHASGKALPTRATYVQYVSLGLLALSIGTLLLYARPGGGPPTLTPILILMGVAIASVVSWLLLRTRHIDAAAVLLLAICWAASNLFALLGNGISDDAYWLTSCIIILAGLFFGWRASAALTVVGVLSGVGLAQVEQLGGLGGIPWLPLGVGAFRVGILGLNAVLVYLLIRRMEGELEDARNYAGDLESSNQELSQAREALEHNTAQLNQSHRELEVTNRKIRQKAAQLEGLANATHRISSVRDLRELLPQIAAAISRNFGFYHVGVFLLDESGDYAILSAANSDAGRRMLERKHRLRVGEQGIVGYVAAAGTPRIAMDVGSDANYFNNPDLPGTRAEMALPLKISDKIIGVLDVQSTQTDAFTEDDISLLTLLANQVALAIENARLFDESRAALAEAEAISRQVTRATWGRLPAEQRLLGYRFDASGVIALETPDQSFDRTNPTIRTEAADSRRVLVPIELRGESIGMLAVQLPVSEDFSRDQLDLIKAVAERVALAAENARLFEETRRRAERERLVSEISGKIRSAHDPGAMIQTAMEELRNALGASRVEVIPHTSSKTDQTRK